MMCKKKNKKFSSRFKVNLSGILNRTLQLCANIEACLSVKLYKSIYASGRQPLMFDKPLQLNVRFVCLR